MNIQPNAQTPGPIAPDTEDGTLIRDENGRGSVVSQGSEWHGSSVEGIANARLLASAYTCFDKAGRDLGIDASVLAESIDLAGLIGTLRSVERGLNDLEDACRRIVGDTGTANLAREKADWCRAALSTLPRETVKPIDPDEGKQIISELGSNPPALHSNAPLPPR